jgi:hypothetical protein
MRGQALGLSLTLPPSSDPSGHLLPGGEKKRVATSCPARGASHVRSLIHEARDDPLAGFSLRGITVLSLLLTMFVKVMESTMIGSVRE